jgi:hypothetical protein
VQSIRRIRHKVTKSWLRTPLTWIRHRGLSASDVFIASYPRSGSTWLRFLLFEILADRPAEFETVDRAVPDVGKHHQAWQLLPGGGRLIKTHETYRSKYTKAIYLVRDIRDVVISEHAFLGGWRLYDKGLDDFIVPFLDGKVNGYGSWHKHVNSWIDSGLAENGHLLVVGFEDMRSDTDGELEKILNFLGVGVDLEMIRTAVDNNTVARMRDKEDRARRTAFREFRRDMRFVRSGSAGGWRQTLTDAQVQSIERNAGGTLTRLDYSLVSLSA